MILILEAGSRPLIGLARGLEAAGRQVTVARDVALDSMKAVRAAVASVKPAAVVLTGGLEDPLACEEEGARAFVLNGEGPIHLAAAALEFRAVPIWISTSAVFGDDGGEHGEDSAPNPTSAYGKSKLQGETFLLRAAKNAIVLRVGHVLEDGLARERAWIASGERIQASDRERMSVVGAYDLGTAIDRLLSSGATGVVHASCGTITEDELWRALGASVEVTARKGGAALFCGRLEKLGIQLRDWRTALEDAARFGAPIVEPATRTHTLAPGAFIRGEGPAEIAVRSGKVVVEAGDDRIVKAGSSIRVDEPYRIVAIDPSEIAVNPNS